MPAPKLLLCDIDGTLVDTGDLILDCLIHATTEHHGVTPTREDFAPALGKPLEGLFEAVSTLYGKTSTPEDYASFKKHFIDYQKERIMNVRAFPGVHNFLRTVRAAGIKTAGITTALDPAARLEAGQITDLLDLVITGGDVKHYKPHPEGIEKALAYFGFSPEEAAMIGDTSVDIEAGKNARTKTIGVTYGQLGAQIRNHNPDHVVDSIEEALVHLGL